MSDLQTTSPTATETDSWQQQCAALQKQVSTLLIGLVVLSATLTFYLWRQSRYTKTDLDRTKLVAGPVIQAFQRDKGQMEKFVADLSGFGRTHPEFLKVLATYNIQLPPPPSAPATAVPAPKAATPPAAGSQKK